MYITIIGRLIDWVTRCQQIWLPNVSSIRHHGVLFTGKEILRTALHLSVFAHGIWPNILYIKHTVSVSTTFSIGLLDHRTSVRTPPKCQSVSYLLVFLNYKLIIKINMPLVKKKVLVLVKKSCFKKETLVQLFGWNDFCHDYKQLKK